MNTNPIKPWPAGVKHLLDDAMTALWDADGYLVQAMDYLYSQPRQATIALWDTVLVMQEIQMLMDQAAMYKPETGRWPQTAKEVRDHTSADAEELINCLQTMAETMVADPPTVAIEIGRSRATIRSMFRRMDTVK